MKNTYEIPQIEVFEVELEGILCASVGGGASANDVEDGGNAWDQLID